MTVIHDRRPRAASLAMCLLVLAAAALGWAGVSAVARQQAGDRPLRVPPGVNPESLPRLAFEDLVYRGAFRLPADASAGDSFAAGGGPLAYNAARGSLYAGTRSGRVAEISVPAPGTSLDVADLPFAAYLQPFADPADGRMSEIAAEGAGLAGLLVSGDRLYGTGLIYYDANHTQAVSHFARPLLLSARGATGMVHVGPPGFVGFVAGYLGAVPPEWQSRLGGTAVTGQCCVPIVSRTSWGPAAFAWTPEELGAGSPVAASPLVYYTSAHPTLGHWDGSNPVYGGTIQMGGIALIGNTRTALFVGRNGTGEFCYGNGTGDRRLDGTRGPDGERYCYDPSNSDKGQHAYPYRYQIWAYDLNDLASVRAGRREPWEARPYGVWPVALPYDAPGTKVGGVAWDAVRRRLFVSQLEADRDGYAYRALIHVFHIP